LAALVAFERRLHESRLTVVSCRAVWRTRSHGGASASPKAGAVSRSELINFVALEVMRCSLRFASDSSAHDGLPEGRPTRLVPAL